MAGSAAALTEREKQVLRLILRGHDAKSIAREQQVSVHTVNERLRSARRKLGVSSSKEAARLLHREEGSPPNSIVAEDIGVESARRNGRNRRRKLDDAIPRQIVVTWSGAAMIGLAIVAAAAMATSQRANMAPEPRPPRVVSTSPASGSIVPPGVLSLEVTFDRPMRPGSFSYVQTDPSTYPNCGRNMPELSADRRTFTLRCQTDVAREYEIWFNRPPYMNFKSDDGIAAHPFQLRFRTRSK